MPSQTKPINLGIPKSFAYHKKLVTTFAPRRSIIVGKQYRFIVFANPKSFQTKKKDEVEFLDSKIEKRIRRLPKDTQKIISELYEKPLSVRLDFYLTPKNIKTTDIDNIAKQVNDLLAGKLFKNDKQIKHLECLKLGIGKGLWGSLGINIKEFKAVRYNWKK